MASSGPIDPKKDLKEKTKLTFSPSYDANTYFEDINLGDGLASSVLSEESINYRYQQAVSSGNPKYVEELINMYKKIKDSLPSKIQAYENEIKKVPANAKYYQSLVKKHQELAVYLDNILSQMQKGIELAKRYYVVPVDEVYNTRGTHAIKRAKEDAVNKRPMDPIFVNFAGTDLDYYAKMYADTYVKEREKVGGRKKSARKTRKVRKTRKHARK